MKPGTYGDAILAEIEERLSEPGRRIRIWALTYHIGLADVERLGIVRVDEKGRHVDAYNEAGERVWTTRGRR